MGIESQHKPTPRTGLVDEVGPELSGLAQLQALIASGRRPGILVTLDLQLVEVDLGLGSMGQCNTFYYDLDREVSKNAENRKIFST